MDNFWSGWIIVLTSANLIILLWLLLATRKGQQPAETEDTTGHAYDGIQEYDNPLPRWWFFLFIGSMVYAAGYLIYYPGMGNWKGIGNWTQVGQYEEEMAEAKQEFGSIFSKYAAMPIEEVIKDKRALKMGQRMFANNCAVCHGSDARGSFGFPNLSDNDWLYGGDAETIKTSITNGRGGIMPAWGNALGENGVDAVANYVMSLSGREVDAELAKKGEAHYKTVCLACHGPDAKGNQAVGAPNLTDKTWLYGGSPDYIKHSIRMGRSGRMPAHKEILGEEKIHLIASYVFSLSQKKD